MSIIETLVKLVDPAEAQRRAEEQRAAREQPRRTDAGDPPRFACRVCGHESPEKSYCPECLADTMEKIPG
jgi:rubrerythrin